MPTIDTPHATIAYDESGTGLPLVLLPSGGHNRHDYDGLRARLSGNIRAIAMDWPGHGDSSPPRTRGGVVQFAETAESFVSQLCPTGAVVMGNSIGGFCATRLAITRPELIRGLVIVDGGGFAGRSPVVRTFCRVMAQPRLLRRIYPVFSRRYMRCRTDADRQAMEIGIETTSRDPGRQVVADLWRSFSSADHDLRSTAATITAPTLILWGEHDPVIPLKIGHRIHSAIAGSELHVFDTGHVPHTTDPAGVAAALIPFLAALMPIDSSEPTADR